MSGDQAGYRLTVNLAVAQVDERGYSAPGLEVREHAQLGAASFMEIAGLLGRFHELTEVIRADQRRGRGPRGNLDVTLWLNGAVMVFGPNGEQMPEIQGTSWAKAVPLLLDRDDVDYHIGLWPDWRKPLTRVHVVLLGNACGWWPPHPLTGE